MRSACSANFESAAKRLVVAVRATDNPARIPLHRPRCSASCLGCNCSLWRFASEGVKNKISGAMATLAVDPSYVREFSAWPCSGGGTKTWPRRRPGLVREILPGVAMAPDRHNKELHPVACVIEVSGFTTCDRESNNPPIQSVILIRGDRATARCNFVCYCCST